MSGKFAGRGGLVDRYLAAHAPAKPEQYWQLVTLVRAKTSILARRQRRAGGDIDSLAKVSRLLSLIGKWYRIWQRPPEQWMPPKVSPVMQIRSLIDHLFVIYTVPPFLYQPWFSGRRDWIRVFLRLARGQSPGFALRKSGLGKGMTKKMGHFFLYAPSHLTPNDAIRWAQIVGWGGSQGQATRWIEARFDTAKHYPEFWPEWIHFLLHVDRATPCGRSVLRLSRDEVHEIERFVIQQKFLPAARVLGYRTGNDLPLQAAFSLRGRSLRSMRRHMRNWRNEVPIPPRATRNTKWLSWFHSDVEDWQIGIDGIEYSIEELLNAHQLVVEGGILGHCVATYARSCYRGRTTIWSLKMRAGKCSKRLLTIEVCPYSRQILTARGRRNRMPTPRQMDLLRLWAKAVGLNRSIGGGSR